MSKIKVLDNNLTNMIAAGEVIERPASIVKELVENSIDAGATIIEVKVRDAGKTFISVKDNGCGMDTEDVHACLLRHATSKIASVNDLFKIGSLGFRGEAIPSIASVSKLTIETSTGEVGNRLVVENGKIVEDKKCSALKGTYIEVEHLFYNTPARFKHLKSDYTELAAISDVLTKLAFAYPNISFAFYNNDKQLFITTGNDDLVEAITVIEGLAVGKAMVPVHGQNHYFKIEGYTSNIKESRSNRYGIITILNGRAVRMNGVVNAVIESYRSILMEGRFPISVLHITCDLSLVDVNVHPSKQEVRLSHELELADLVSNSIKEALKGNFMVPEINVTKEEKEVYEQPKLDLEYNFKREETPLMVEEPKVVLGEIKQEVKPDIVTTNKPYKHYMNIIGQIHGTYIIGEDEEGMYLIDQHAAMERINYERFSRLIKSESEITDLLIPIVLEYDVSTSLEINKYLPILDDFGLHLEPFGINTYRISTIPVWMKEADIREYARSMIEQVINSSKIDLDAIREYAVSTLACKASLKANRILSFNDMEVLVQRLFDECENPFTCAHGRPTIIKITNYELERMFKRK